MKRLNLLAIGLLVLSGCHAHPSALEGNLQPTAIMSHHNTTPLPYGVFDVQSGHGKGKWRQSTDPLAR